MLGRLSLEGGRACGVLNGPQRGVEAKGGGFARFVFGGGLNESFAEEAEFYGDGAEGGVRLDDLAAERFSSDGFDTESECGGFGENDLRDGGFLRGGAQDGEDGSRPMLFHLDGGMPHVECACSE